MDTISVLTTVIVAACMTSNPSLTEGYCEEVSDAIVTLSDDAGVDPLVVAAIAHVESRFVLDAMGRGGECGMFQQNPTLVNVPGGIPVPEAPTEPVHTCEWLKGNPRNAMQALLAHHFHVAAWPSVSSGRRTWLAAYNGGTAQHTYSRTVTTRANTYRQELAAALTREAEALASREE